ncbi:MAG TPA: non-ribosomal peptide synthetase [Candidatus Dormibacteraeota bacterium]|nr:non-ribosomal peptide synthetase [Candidatus Dormibacteraeota bacterium]
MHERFDEQAAARPDAVAVRFGDAELTYGALNRRANQLANHLRALGAGPETAVGITTERSLDLPVGLLAILKAGAAYVPLDTRYPRERLAVLAADAGVHVILTHELHEPHVEGLAGVVRFDRDREAIEARPTSSPTGRTSPDGAAYVAFTSGSTGTPKGACIPHRAVTRLVVDPNFIAIEPGDVFLQLAPLAFDASTLELWGPLLNGARLVVFPDHDPSLTELAGLLQREGVTTLWLTAGLFHQMVEEAVDGFRGVRQLIAGGDVLSVPHVNRLLAEVPGVRLVNGYGPTENTTFTCCHSIGGPVETATVPIGRPISGTGVHVLDADLRPVADGVPGELCAVGDGLARGYVNQPGATAERFVPDPAGGAPGGRLYRTGDRGRRLPDGTIEFLGRLDSQVKVRGFRIEPGEVESAIRRHPDVTDAVVVAQEHERGGKRLVAYVVPAHEVSGLGLALRGQLAGTLPPYAVPSSFVLVDALPLNANGKVDRKALPVARRQSRPEVSAGYAEPRTSLEESLAALWADLLEVTEVGIDDDFFELGGHSLVATRITAEILQAYGVDVPPAEFYERPTVANLARTVDELRRAPAGQATRP